MEYKRVVAFIIDFILTSLIQSVLMMSYIMTIINSQKIYTSTLPIVVLLITFISMLYMIFRDCLGGKSIGKRIMKLEIISIDTMKQATLTNRLLRNITWLLGPVEIVYYLVSKKRIGDQISRTKVIC